MSSSHFLFASGLAVALLAPLSTAAAEKGTEKTPPSCGAVNFRPVTGSPNDGILDAGLYRSRFGKVVLKAEASGGSVKNYYIEINDKRPAPMKGALPASVTPCLNAKHVKTPPPPAGDSCLGERFRVVLDHVAKTEYVMLFGLQGETWKLCSASQL